MTGNGKHSTYKTADDWGMVYSIVLTTLSYIINGNSRSLNWRYLPYLRLVAKGIYIYIPPIQSNSYGLKNGANVPPF